MYVSPSHFIYSAHYPLVELEAEFTLCTFFFITSHVYLFGGSQGGSMCCGNEDWMWRFEVVGLSHG